MHLIYKNNDRLNKKVWNIGELYEKYSSILSGNVSRDVEGLVVASAASVKYTNIHTRNSHLIGLLEVLLVDETSKTSALLFQSWGQTASDHHRFKIQNGGTLILDSLSLMLRGDGLLVARGNLVYCGEPDSAVIDHSSVKPWFPPALIKKLAGLSAWCIRDPHMTLIHARPPVVAAVASLADIMASVDVQLFSLPLHLSLEQTTQDSISVPEILFADCLDATGARVALQCESPDQYRQLVSTARTCASSTAPTSDQTLRAWLTVTSVRVGSSYHGTIKRLRAHAGTTFAALDRRAPEAAANNKRSAEEMSGGGGAKEAAEVLSWAELKAVLSDGRLLAAHSSSLKAVRCALSDICFESDKQPAPKRGDGSTGASCVLDDGAVMRNIRIVRPSAGGDSSGRARKRACSAVGAAEATAAPVKTNSSGGNGNAGDGDDGESRDRQDSGVHVSYRDVRAVLGAPTDSAMTGGQHDALRERYDIQPTVARTAVTTTQSGAALTQSHWGTCTDGDGGDAAATTQQQHMRAHWYSAPQSCPRSLPSSSYNAHSDLVSAVIHDAALARVLGGIPAALVAAQASKARLQQQQRNHAESSGRPEFDFVGAVGRAMAALKAGAEGQRDCLCVLRLCPVLDENGMVAANCVFSVEDILP